MSNLMTLVKNEFIGAFDIKKKNKTDKPSKFTFKTFIILVAVVGLLISTLYNGIFSLMFYSAKESMIYPVLLFSGFAAFLTFTTSLTKVKGIFTCKDYEMLASMPIKKCEIITAKISTLYLVELFYTVILLLPNMIFATAFSGNYLFILSGILAIFLVPALPMIVATLLSVFITLIADRSRFGNIISIIFYMVFMAVIMYFSISMNSTQVKVVDGEEVADLSNIIRMCGYVAWVNPSVKLIELAFTNNMLYLLAFVGTNIVVLIMAILLIASLYDVLHVVTNTYYGSNKYDLKKIKQEKNFTALFKHEAKRFFSSKIYSINCIMSGISAILMSAPFAFFLGPYSDKGLDANTLAIFSKFAYLAVLLLMFGIGIATPASASISMEGKNIWILKSMPVNVKDLLKAKVLFSTLVLAPFGIIASVIVCILLKAEPFSYIMMSMLSIAYIFLVSTIGLSLNLWKYKLDWNNEQEVTKNSKNAWISMLIDWAVTAGISALVLPSLIGLAYGDIFIHSYMTIVFVVVSLVGYIIYKKLLKNGERRFENIE